MSMIRIRSIGTAAPPQTLRQETAREMAREAFAGRSAVFERMADVFDNAGIDTRHVCVDLDWFNRSHGWPERSRVFEAAALDLAEESARRCLTAAAMEPGDVDHLVVVSTTGITTPSLDARLMARLPFRPDVQRLPVFGLGCAGGVLGLARGAALALGKPGTRVLVIAVELCAETFRLGDLSKSNVIATALFGDGAAAVLLESRDAADAPEATPSIRAWGEHLWPSTLDVMGWTVEADGLGVLFSRDIPALVRRDAPAVIDRFLTRQGMARDHLAGVVCHPGGAKVLASLEDVFALGPGALGVEADVLRRFGNMSSATVLFVLSEKLAQARTGPHLMLALGPGFTLGLVLLDL